jgi:FMN reductase (NADPH)
MIPASVLAAVALMCTNALAIHRAMGCYDNGLSSCPNTDERTLLSHVQISETMRVLEQRVSVRKYSDTPVSEAQIDALLTSAFRAPTSSNIQSYSVIVVRGADTKAGIAKAAGGQQHVIDCPVFLAFCADLTRIEAAMSRDDTSIANNNLELGLVSTLDAALVGMATSLAAESVGLRGVMIGGARNDPEEIARLLGLPPRVFCVFGMCLGYADAVPQQKPRMALDTVRHFERYAVGHQDGAINAYDRELADHYRQGGRETTDNSWSHDVSSKFGARPRDRLRSALARMGFDFA